MLDNGCFLYIFTWNKQWMWFSDTSDSLFTDVSIFSVEGVRLYPERNYAGIKWAAHFLFLSGIHQ